MNKTTTETRETTIDRLVLFIESKRMCFREFEQIIGIGNGYIGKQLKRRGGIGSNIMLKIIIEYPELNINWLITGKQKMIKGNKLKLLKQRKSSSSKVRASA